MRLPSGGFGKDGRARLGQALGDSQARLGRALVRSHARLGRVASGSHTRLERVASGSQTHLARVVAGSHERVGRALAEHGGERLARVVVVGVVALMGGGTAAALAVLPSEREVGVAEGGGTGQSHRFAVGQLVAEGQTPRRAGPSYYAKTAARRVPASTGSGFMPLYREAARSFGVSWRLIASIHRQETAFSTAPSTYHGLNPFGCCAGPMQFNVTNGPPSTWALYRQSFRRGNRPSRYPHPTLHHPSIYDDFDAIMAAAALLRDGGASDALDGGSWSAAYAYYGHDLFGIEYASQVLGRAKGWERDGFCVNCPVDASLVEEFDDAYGVGARRQALAEERREKLEKKKRKARRKKARAQARERKARAEARRRAEKEAAPRKTPRRATPRERARPRPAQPSTQTTPDPPPSATTPTTTTGPPPPPAPPPASNCSGLKKLLGC